MTVEIKHQQIAYHDWEAATYEDKFSIAFDQRCIDYAIARFRKAVPPHIAASDVLEIGAGTGFLSINLALGGYLQGARICATDISSGMLDRYRANASRHQLDADVVTADVEALPFADSEFDLVIGHAVLHHIPIPGLALREIQRVLRPGGRLMIAGEPTYAGERITSAVKRVTAGTVRWLGSRAVGPRVGIALRGDAQTQHDPVASLEHEVDLHTFRPTDLAHMADVAGFVDVQVITEELLSNWFGWSVRTIEGMVDTARCYPRWPSQVFRVYQRLNRFDETVMPHVVPRALFYNAILAARKPRVAPS